ncbi:hypothetical protein HAX54_004239 [Datura stramonium]|uniref:Uncharacterized protein n=1 Tax=Datura stramonium TaxID=4076 RepID=A0ABS8T7D5_DATST|nr:hypothetical protein [Datura stramonium]
MFYGGHTLCKNCILGLQWAVVKFPTLPLQLPLFIACPWCNMLSLRLVYRGNLKFPRKNFFLLWMLEKSSGSDHDHNHISGSLAMERLHSSLRKSLVFFVHLTAKFPLVVIFLLIIMYAIPASAAILALYMLITVVFALPSFLILYFAYQVWIGWLEIIT